MADQRELSSLPGMRGLYGKAALGFAVKPVFSRAPVIGGRFGGGKPRLPAQQLVLKNAKVDRDNLTEYDHVCGFHVSDELPPTYPHMLTFPLHMQLMTATDFPFPVIGLLHIRNRIVQQRPLRDDERPTLRVWAEALEQHPKGLQFEMHAEAEVDGAPVWRSVSTYLRKGAGGDGGNGSEKKRSDSGSGSDSDGDDREREPNAVWEVPDDIGRRYGSVSGDTNPIHLRRSTAMAFGMPRAIAHGMWTKARCLAALEGQLPDALDVDVAFKLPVFLPSKVALSSWEDGDARSFSLESAKDGKPHLAGTVRSA